MREIALYFLQPSKDTKDKRIQNCCLSIQGENEQQIVEKLKLLTLNTFIIWCSIQRFRWIYLYIYMALRALLNFLNNFQQCLTSTGWLYYENMDYHQWISTACLIILLTSSTTNWFWNKYFFFKIYFICRKMNSEFDKMLFLHSHLLGFPVP